MGKYIEGEYRNGSRVYFEIDKNSGELDRYGGFIEKASAHVDSSIKIEKILEPLIQELSQTELSQAEITFGLKLHPEMGNTVITEGITEAHFQIKALWKRD